MCDKLLPRWSLNVNALLNITTDFILFQIVAWPFRLLTRRASIPYTPRQPAAQGNWPQGLNAKWVCTYLSFTIFSYHKTALVQLFTPETLCSQSVPWLVPPVGLEHRVSWGWTGIQPNNILNWPRRNGATTKSDLDSRFDHHSVPATVLFPNFANSVRHPGWLPSELSSKKYFFQLS